MFYHEHTIFTNILTRIAELITVTMTKLLKYIIKKKNRFL